MTALQQRSDRWWPQLALTKAPLRLGALFLTAAGLVLVLHLLDAPVTLLLATPFDVSGWGEYRWTRRLWLVPHAAGASVALLLGPLQFTSIIRRRFPHLHRGLGKVYICGSVLGCLGAFGLTVRMGNADAIWSALTLVLLWIVALGAAIIAIARKRFQLHGAFMLRTYVFMLAFVFFGLFHRVFDSQADGMRANLDWMYWLWPWVALEIYVGWFAPLFTRGGGAVAPTRDQASP